MKSWVLIQEDLSLPVRIKKRKTWVICPGGMWKGGSWWGNQIAGFLFISHLYLLLCSLILTRGAGTSHGDIQTGMRGLKNTGSQSPLLWTLPGRDKNSQHLAWYHIPQESIVTHVCTEMSPIIDLSTIPAYPAPVHTLDIPGKECGGVQHRQLEETWQPRLQNTGTLSRIQDLSCSGNTIFQRTIKACYIWPDSVQGLGPQPALRSYSRSRENHIVLKPQEHVGPSLSPLAMSIYREEPRCPKRPFVPEEREAGLTDKIPFFTTTPWG